MSTTDLTNTLADLAGRINHHHRQAEVALNSGLQHALEAGRLLIEVKGQVEHGGWTVWLQEHFEGSERTARAYMQVAKHWPELEAKRQTSAILSLDGALKVLAGPKDQEPWDAWEAAGRLRDAVDRVRKRYPETAIGAMPGLLRIIAGEMDSELERTTASRLAGEGEHISHRTSSLDDVGNQNAPPGSRDWAVWLIGQVKVLLNRLDSTASTLRDWLFLLEEHKAWKSLDYASMDLLCAKEIGVDSPHIDAIKCPSPRNKRSPLEVAKNILSDTDRLIEHIERSDRGSASQRERYATNLRSGKWYVSASRKLFTKSGAPAPPKDGNGAQPAEEPPNAKQDPASCN